MPAKFVGPITVLCFVALCILALSGGSIWLMSLGLLIPLLVFLIGKRELLILAVFWTYNSTLRIPGIPGDLTLTQLLMVAFCIVSVAHAIIQPPRSGKPSGRTWAILFGCVLAMIMAVRGTGFRQLGGALWGGARYVDILVALGFFLFASTMTLTERQWKVGLFGMHISGLLPAGGELLYVLSNGAIYHQYYLMQAAHTTGLTSFQFEGGEMARFTRMAALSPVYLLPFIFWRDKPGRGWRYVLFVSFGLFLGGFSGHRIILVKMMLFIWLFFFLQSRRKVFFTLSSSIMGATVLLALGQAAPFLPLPFQRMLSFVPFAHVDALAAADAASTITWRVLLWKRAIMLIPDYLWIGKGYAFPFALAQAQDVKLLPGYHLWWAMVQTAYHQGILSLLVGMGLPGLVTGLSFLFSVYRSHRRFSLAPWSIRGFQNMHYAFLVLFLMEILTFIAIYGDVFISFPTLFLHAAILNSLYASYRLTSEREDV